MDLDSKLNISQKKKKMMDCYQVEPENMKTSRDPDICLGPLGPKRNHFCYQGKSLFVLYFAYYLSSRRVLLKIAARYRLSSNQWQKRLVSNFWWKEGMRQNSTICESIKICVLTSSVSKQQRNKTFWQEKQASTWVDTTAVQISYRNSQKCLAENF